MEKQKLIDALYYCAAQCTHCYDACHLEHKKEMELCMQHDLDCAELCRLTGQVLERKSPNADLFLKLCAQMCKRCANECANHKHLEHCQKCADACTKCAEMCHHEEVTA